MELLTGFSPRKIIQNINELIREVRSLQPKAGRGLRINKRAGGTVYDVLIRGGGSGSEGAEYYGSFKTELEEGLLKVGDGYLLRNGELLKVFGREKISPHQGWLCVVSEISGEEFTEPEIQFTEIKNTAFPVAYIHRQDDGSWLVMQMPVAVAVIIAAKPCAISMIGQGKGA